MASDRDDVQWPDTLDRVKAAVWHRSDCEEVTVKTQDLAFVLERLDAFASVAMGNAAEIGRLEARVGLFATALRRRAAQHRTDREEGRGGSTSTTKALELERVADLIARGRFP